MRFRGWLGCFPVRRPQGELAGVGTMKGIRRLWQGKENGSVRRPGQLISNSWRPVEAQGQQEDCATSEQNSEEGRMITGDPSAHCYQYKTSSSCPVSVVGTKPPITVLSPSSHPSSRHLIHFFHSICCNQKPPYLWISLLVRLFTCYFLTCPLMEASWGPLCSAPCLHCLELSML